MKRFVCTVVALAMLVVGVAWAEEEELHLLWGIEFGQDIETVQEILKNEHGLDMVYNQIENSGTKYELLSCKNVEEMTILGYPLKGFSWRLYKLNDSREESVTIVFLKRDKSELYGMASEEKADIMPLTNILGTLVKQFGPVDFATYTIYSDGVIAWQLKDRDSIYEFKHFKDLDIGSLTLRSILDATDYLTEESVVKMEIYIGNILIFCSTRLSTDYYNINVTFANSVYEDTQEDTYEEFKLAHYEDKGF